MRISEFLGPDGLILVSGAVGSIVSAITHDGNNAAKLRIVSVGTLSSYFLHPLALPAIEGSFGIIGADTDGALPLAGFIVGAFAIIIVETLKLALTKRRDDLLGNKEGDE